MALREYVDSSGVEWQVWHVVPTARTATPPFGVERRKRADPNYPGDRRKKSFALTPEMESGWLCFESAAEKRRLVPVPDDWESCDDATLGGYLASAQGVARRIIDGEPSADGRTGHTSQATA